MSSEYELFKQASTVLTEGVGAGGGGGGGGGRAERACRASCGVEHIARRRVAHHTRHPRQHRRERRRHRLLCRGRLGLRLRARGGGSGGSGAGTTAGLRCGCGGCEEERRKEWVQLIRCPACLHAEQLLETLAQILCQTLRGDEEDLLRMAAPIDYYIQSRNITNEI